MNSLSTIPQEKIKLKKIKKTKKPIIKIPKISNPFTNSKTNKGVKEISWDNRFDFNKILHYHNIETSRENSHKLNNKNQINTSGRKIESYLRQSATRNSNLNQENNTSGNKQFYPKSRLTSYRIKMLCSAKSRINSLTQRNIFSPILKNGFNFNYVDINSTNLVNLDKIWDEFCINKQYRNYFKYVYKELDPSYKQELYQKEIEEIKDVQNCIKDLKYFINLRKEDLSEIKNMNDNLEQELLNKNQNGKEIILGQISGKIAILREHTVNICKSLRKLKYYIFSINNLEKYNFDKLSKKFDFDKNYLIKMKSELKFLREGFAKYYFNIENDQTPFLLKASDKTKINEGDYFLRVIPLTEELRKDILDCNYYIHQELIAYQNANFDRKNFRCISPIKRDGIFIEENFDKKFKINQIKGSITERRKDEIINGIEDRVVSGSLRIWPNIKYSKDIDLYFETKKKRRSIDVNKNRSSSNIYKINQFNNFFKKNLNTKKKIKGDINYLIKTEINKSESKIQDNMNDKNTNK